MLTDPAGRFSFAREIDRERRKGQALANTCAAVVVFEGVKWCKELSIFMQALKY